MFCYKNKFVNFSETNKFSTESFLTFRELQPLVSYKRVSYKKIRVLQIAAQQILCQCGRVRKCYSSWKKIINKHHQDFSKLDNNANYLIRGLFFY